MVVFQSAASKPHSVSVEPKKSKIIINTMCNKTQSQYWILTEATLMHSGCKQLNPGEHQPERNDANYT